MSAWLALEARHLTYRSHRRKWQCENVRGEGSSSLNLGLTLMSERRFVRGSPPFLHKREKGPFSEFVVRLTVRVLRESLHTDMRTCTHRYVCKHTYICTYIHMYVYMPTRVCLRWMHACIVYMCMYTTFICMYTCIHRKHTYICKYTYRCMWVYIHTCM